MTANTSHINQRRTPKGVPGAGEFAGINRPGSSAAPLTLPTRPTPSPAAVAAFASRQRLATAPKQEPNYTVGLAALPVRDVNLGRGIDLDTFAGMYPDMDTWTWDDDGEVVDFDPRTADDLQLEAWKGVISNGYHLN